MKLIAPLLTGRSDDTYFAASDYERTHQGALSILAKSRPTASWSRVSPAVLGEIDQYVRAHAGLHT
jgi:hypothetical protein